MKKWNRFWFEPGPASTLGACRAVFFTGLCLWQIPLDYSAWAGYSPVFWMPIWLFETLSLPLFSPGVVNVIQTVFKLSLVLSAIGLFTRGAMLVAFALGIYLLGLPHNFGQTQHFDTLPVFVIGMLAVSRAADTWSIDSLVAAVRRRSSEVPAPSSEYTWPIRFVWVAMAFIFCAAGISKLRRSGLEWAFSDNMAWLLQRQQYHISDGEPWTSWGVFVARHGWMAQAMAATALSVETLFPLSLFSRTARLILVPAGLSFLIGIRALMGPTFEQFMLCYVFWLPLDLVAGKIRAWFGNRAARLVLYDDGCGVCSRSAIVLARLDLLHRLRFAGIDNDWSQISARHPDLDRDACLAEMHVITDRGTIVVGFDAYRSLAQVIPAGWFVLPILYVPGVPAIGRRLYRLVASNRATSTCAVPLPRA